MCFKRGLLRGRAEGIAVRKSLIRLLQRVDELLAFKVRHRHPRVLTGEGAPRLGLENIEIVLKQGWRPAQCLRERHILTKLGIDRGGDRTSRVQQAAPLALAGRLGQVPNNSDNDKVERHRQGERNGRYARADAQARKEPFRKPAFKPSSQCAARGRLKCIVGRARQRITHRNTSTRREPREHGK